MGTLLRRSFIHWAAGKGIKYSKGFTGVPYLSTGVTESGWANTCVRVCVCAFTEPPREEDYLQNKTFIFIMYPRRPLFQQPSLLLIFQWKLFEGRNSFPKYSSAKLVSGMYDRRGLMWSCTAMIADLFFELSFVMFDGYLYIQYIKMNRRTLY